ncbi:hypothetical protein LPJ74_003222 [Coemansia sp. RSA 1843]|nr:hypothetical protein LPJ74_003222 [Coemansia sp. RSA 1843]
MGQTGIGKVVFLDIVLSMQTTKTRRESAIEGELNHQRSAYPDNSVYSQTSTDTYPDTTNNMVLGRSANAPAAVIMREKQQLHQTGKYRQLARDVAPAGAAANTTGKRLSSRNIPADKRTTSSTVWATTNNNSANYSSVTINARNDGSSSPGLAIPSAPTQHASGGPNGTHGSTHRRSASLLGRLRHSASASPSGSPTSSEGSSRDTARSERTLAHSASSGSMRKRKQAGLQRTHLAYAEVSAMPVSVDDATMIPRTPSATQLGGADHTRQLRPQTSRPSVRVLPPQSDAARSPENSGERTAASPATKASKKRHSLRGGDSRSASGFISHLLRGSARSAKSPHAAGASPADSAGSKKFAHSPGTPQTARPHGSVGGTSPQEFDDSAAAEYNQLSASLSPPHQQHHHQHHVYGTGFSPPNVCSAEYPPVCMTAAVSTYTASDGHSIQCADHVQQQPGVFCMQNGNIECLGVTTVGMESAGDNPPHVSATMAPSAAATANGHPVNLGDFYYMQHGNGSNNMLGQVATNGMADAGAGDGGGYSQADNWYEANGPPTNGTDSSNGMVDSAQLTSRLVSSLPVYEPIDLSRVHQMPHHGYARATRPVLPDARMLAPMTSLAEVYSSGAADYNSLSTRELRFAVENHMLVEQHKYLIRDLGHARSAIGALKQVVQDKEDRLEQFEMANMELQQRLVLVESLLTQEQRERIESLRYSMGPASSALSSAQVDADDGASGRQAQGADYDSLLSAQPDDSSNNNEEDNAHSMGSGGLAVKLSASTGQKNEQPGVAAPRMAGPGSPAGNPANQESKRNNRPLSGYTTRYDLKTKPVHQLPRVFSGDYSTTDVQAMEHSVEALATAITSMPSDDTSVEEIIASKMAEDDQNIRDQIRADAAHTESGQQTADTQGRRHAREDGAESPQEPKRRSRFLSMLRLSTFGGSSPSARDQQQQQQGETELESKRRSVSLGTRKPNQLHSNATTLGSATQRSTSVALHEVNALAGGARSRSNSGDSLAASCPTLLPGIAKHKSHQKEQHTLHKQPSSGSRFYPSGLGLSTENSSAATSRQSSTKASSTTGRTRNNTHQAASVATSAGQVSAKRDTRRRLSHRLSLTSQPRRSTSAPSRPQSMRVARRKSWLFQWFNSSSSVESAASSEHSNDDDGDTSDHGSVDDDGMGRRISRRRRVLTQSSDEITQFLGRLRLEDGGGGTHVGVGGVLEDVIDVSGEDEERANRVSMSVAEVRQQTLDALNGTVRATQQSSFSGTRLDGSEKGDVAAESTNSHSASSEPSERCSTRSAASSTDPKDEDHPTNDDSDADESVDHSISRWRQRDASGPTIRRLNPPPPITTTTTASVISTSESPSRDSTLARPSTASLGLGVSVARRDRTPISFLPSITQTTGSHSPATPTRKDSGTEDGKSPAASTNGGTPTRHIRHSSGASVQSDGSSARKWAPAFWAPPSLNYHAGPLGSPTAGAAVGSSWSPRGSIDSIERRPSYSRRPSEESRYRSPHGSIGFSAAAAAAASSGGGPSSSTGRGGGGGGSGSPWELVKFSESRTFPLSPSHSRPGTPPSRPLGFFEDTTVPDSDELTVAARRSLSLRMSRNAFRKVEPLPESDDISDSLIHSDNEHASKSERKLDSNEGRSSKRASCIRVDSKQAAATVDTSKTKQGQAKNPALSRVAGSAQHKRRSLLWQFKEAKGTSTNTIANKALGGQLDEPPKEPSSSSSSSSSHVHECSENALVSDTRELPRNPRGGDFNGINRLPENAGHLNGGGGSGGARKHKRWWSVVLG